jgi:hypothetical protein
MSNAALAPTFSALNAESMNRQKPISKGYLENRRSLLIYVVR